jgi:hypothetical protein
MGNLIAALVDWIEERPGWLRPALYAALLVPAWAFKKGGLVILPILIIGILVAAEHPVRTLGVGLLIFAIAMAGAALSGLAYSFLGRHLRHTSVIGPYLAGWLSAWPYVLAVLIIIRLHKDTPLAAPVQNAELFTLVLMILYVGSTVGFIFFRND